LYRAHKIRTLSQVNKTFPTEQNVKCSILLERIYDLSIIDNKRNLDIN